jgi:hypothetical protein
LGFFSKKPQNTGLAGMAHPPYVLISLIRYGFLALKEFSVFCRTKKWSKIVPKKSFQSLFLARIFDQWPPRGFDVVALQNDERNPEEATFSDSGHTLGYRHPQDVPLETYPIGGDPHIG